MNCNSNHTILDAVLSTPSVACSTTMRTTKRRDRVALGPLKKIGATTAIERLAVFMMGGFWGLVLLGVAIWLLHHDSPGGAVACLTFSGGYFWFAWIGYHDRH